MSTPKKQQQNRAPVGGAANQPPDPAKNPPNRAHPQSQNTGQQLITDAEIKALNSMFEGFKTLTDKETRMRVMYYIGLRYKLDFARLASGAGFLHAGTTDTGEQPGEGGEGYGAQQPHTLGESERVTAGSIR